MEHLLLCVALLTGIALVSLDLCSNLLYAICFLNCHSRSENRLILFGLKEHKLNYHTKNFPR